MTCTKQIGPSSNRLKQAQTGIVYTAEKERKKGKRERERERERGHALLRSVYEHRRKSSNTKRAGPW
jgi:hypothetical protein